MKKADEIKFQLLTNELKLFGQQLQETRDLMEKLADAQAMEYSKDAGIWISKGAMKSFLETVKKKSV